MYTCWNLLLRFLWFRINIFSHWMQRSFFPCWSQNNRWTSCIEFVFRHSVLLFRGWFYVPDDDTRSARCNNSFLEQETSIDTICGKKIFQIYAPTFIDWGTMSYPGGYPVRCNPAKAKWRTVYVERIFFLFPLILFFRHWYLSRESFKNYFLFNYSIISTSFSYSSFFFSLVYFAHRKKKNEFVNGNRLWRN